MAKITIQNLDEEVLTKLRVQAAENGHSLEEEARRILHSAFAQEPTADEQTEKELTPIEVRLLELENRGELIRAKNRKREFKPGKHVPGVLERFLAER